MDIKLVKNTQEGIFSPINDRLMMQIVDDNYQYHGLSGKKYFILNAATNEKFELAPHIKKYSFTRIKYACDLKNYIFFTSLESVTENKTSIVVYRFLFDSNESEAVYNMEIDNADIDSAVRYYIFAMDSNFFFVERLENGVHTDVFLHDINSDRDIDLSDTFIKDMGIYKVLPAGCNNCVIKFGIDKISDGGSDEKIAVFNAKQLVSEILFNGQELTMDVLDESDDDTTFPYIKRNSGKIIYSKFNFKNKVEEIIIYDAESKTKKVRLNNNVEHAMDLSYTFIINDTPYIMKNDNDTVYFVNLDNQKTDYTLRSDMLYRFMMNDIVVVTRMRHWIPLFKKTSEYIEAYRISDMHHAIFTTKAVYNGCVISGDDLIIFTK